MYSAFACNEEVDSPDCRLSESVFGGYYGWKNWQKANPAAVAPERPTTATAELRSINFAVNAAGEIAPAEQVSVRPEINGKVDPLPVDLGDHLKKGAVLFKLDDKELQQQRASNVTDIDKAKLSLEKAERDHKRAQQLLADKLISQEVYDDTKTTYDLAKNALESSQRALALVDEHLTKTEVRAPFDCTVLTRPVSIGQAVSGSDGFNGGTEVLTIADLNAMIINAQVNQADVPRLKVGETVEVSVEAVPGLRSAGKCRAPLPASNHQEQYQRLPGPHRADERGPAHPPRHDRQRQNPGRLGGKRYRRAAVGGVHREEPGDQPRWNGSCMCSKGTPSRSATSRWASLISPTPKFKRASRRAKPSRWCCPRKSARSRRGNWPARRRVAATLAPPPPRPRHQPAEPAQTRAEPRPAAAPASDSTPKVRLPVSSAASTSTSSSSR